MIRHAGRLGALFTLMGLVGVAGCERGEAGGPPQRPAVAVEVVAVEPATLREQVRGIGTMRALAMVELRPEISGVLRAVHFDEGARVERGQILFELDDAKIQRQLAVRQAALGAARTRLASAERTYDRVVRLRDRELASPEEFEQAQSARDQAEAEVEQAAAEKALVEQQLLDARIVAPISGYVSERRVDAGTYVQSGSLLATLYYIDEMEIEFTIPERYMGRIQRGQPVETLVAAFTDRRFDGVVEFVSPAIDPSTRDFLVKARVDNPQGLLRPGAFATVLVTVDVREQRPMIPEEALVATRHGYVVFVVNGETAQQRSVSIGLRQAGQVEITDGLEPGEAVVRIGHMRLSHGDRVQVTNAADPAPPALGDARAE